MSITEFYYRLPFGWSCDTRFVVVDPEPLPAGRAWRMRRLHQLVVQGEDTLGALLDQYVDSAAKTCDSLRRLVDRGMLRVERR